MKNAQRTYLFFLSLRIFQPLRVQKYSNTNNPQIVAVTGNEEVGADVIFVWAFLAMHLLDPFHSSCQLETAEDKLDHVM